MKPAQQLAAIDTEIERLKARLDLMERQISGDDGAWWQVTVNLPETVAEVTVDKVLAEARQTAVALAGLIKTRASLSGEQERPQAPADPLDDLGRKREEKLKEAQLKAAQAQ